MRGKLFPKNLTHSAKTRNIKKARCVLARKFENGCQPTMASSPLTVSLQTESQRLVYLITYSRIDATKFPTRESFSKAVLEGWQNRGMQVLQWVVSLEIVNRCQ